MEPLSPSAAQLAARPGNRAGVGRGRTGSLAEMVHEFRNHLALLVAGITELRSTVPTGLAAGWGHTLADMEASMDLMDSMLTWIEASVDPAVDEGPEGVFEAAAILERARMMAAPLLGGRTKLTLLPRPATFRNRGAVVECALAALISHLARPDSPLAASGALGQAAPGREIRVAVEGGAETAPCFVLTVHDPAGVRRTVPARGWRISLAESLLAPLGGSVGIVHGDEDGRSGLLVRFALQ